MAESKSKSSLMKKYVSILQTDSKPGTAKPLYSSSSSLNRTSSQVLEKVILSRKLNINQSLSSFQDTPTIMQPSSTKAKHSGFDFIPTPNYRTPRPSITVSALPFQGYHGRSSSQEDFPPETLNTIKYDMQQGNTLLSPKDSVVEVPTYFKIKSIKNVSKTFDKDMTLHSLYEGAREVSAELESIVSQKYQKKLEESMSKFQTKDFISIQSLRVANVLKVLEKNFVEGQIKEPQLLQEIWKMVSIEITKIKTVYNEFLESFNNLTSKLKDKQKTLDSQDLIDGLKNLILYSECYRNIGSTWDPEHREKNLDDLKKAMHIYKLDLKYKSKTNRKTFEVYEHAEGHVKGLNKLLDTETEKVQSLLEENIRLVKQRDELVSRQAALKNEIVTIMDRKETELRNKVKEGLPDFQRKVYEGQISEQDKQVKKLTADNEHLKATVRTLKEDLKKFNEKGSAVGGKHDKGTMVNFYSDAPQKVKSTFKFCMNFSQSPITITTGTKLPDVLALSIVSLVYSDKLMSDIVDDFEKRPRKALGPYLFEWLLTKFGIFTVGEEILKDFLFTMKNSKVPYERYKTFLSMIGMQEVIAVPKKGKNDPETSIDVKEIKKKTYMTAECIKILHKFIEQVNTLNSNADSPTLKLPMHDFGPFLPREDSTKAVVNMQIARQIMNNLFKEYGFSVSESEDALDELHIVQQQTFWQKMNAKATIDEFTKDDDTIKFDALIDYLLDLCIGRQAKVVEKLYIALHATTTSSNEANISFEEFCSAVGKIFPKKSQIWKGHIFTKLMDQPTAGQIGLHKLIPNMIGALYQEDQVRDFQPPKLKKESIANSGSKTPKSPKKNSGSNTPKSPKTDKRWDETRYDQQFLIPDAVDENKAAFQYGTKGLNEMAYHHYDAVSSLIVLQEIFYLMEAPIKEAQEANEVLNFTYKTFLAEIKIFPKHFGYIANYKDIMIMKKKELVNLLEYLWGLLRTMLVQTFRDTIKSP